MTYRRGRFGLLLSALARPGRKASGPGGGHAVLAERRDVKVVGRRDARDLGGSACQGVAHGFTMTLIDSRSFIAR